MPARQKLNEQVQIGTGDMQRIRLLETLWIHAKVINRLGGDAASLTINNNFTGVQSVTPYRANISGAVTIDFAVANSNNLHLTLVGNVSSFALTNPTDGAIYSIRFIQDATGGRTMPAMPSSIKFPNGDDPVFITTANAVNFLSLQYGSVEASYMGSFLPGMA